MRDKSVVSLWFVRHFRSIYGLSLCSSCNFTYRYPHQFRNVTKTEMLHSLTTRKSAYIPNYQYLIAKPLTSSLVFYVS